MRTEISKIVCVFLYCTRETAAAFGVNGVYAGLHWSCDDNMVYIRTKLFVSMYIIATLIPVSM